MHPDLVLLRWYQPDEFKLLTSKSWRQMPVTWGLLCELTPAQMVALGNWTDQQQDRTVSAMPPIRYTGSKQHLALCVEAHLRCIPCSRLGLP